MKSYQEYQDNLLTEIEAQNGNSISVAIKAAFLAMPRHWFIDNFFDHNEQEEIVERIITETNLSKYLPLLYGNHPLGLALNEEGYAISTISQPSAVLMMLKKLDIRDGHKVLEIGTASGWNAAMLSKLVGENGAVHSIEIISDLAKRAKEKMAKYRIPNVHLYDGDGAVQTYGQTFDRIIFTVGAYDVPKIMFQQLKSDGLLLMVLKTSGLHDSMILLQKKGNHLVSLTLDACRFVPLTGKYAMPQLDAIKVESLPLWQKIKDNVVKEQAFWWGNKSNNPRTKLVKLVGITSFLGIVEPQFQLFKRADKELSFGLVDAAENSLAIWAENKLTGYGNEKGLNQLKKAFQLYFDLGMPSANCFQLKVYPMEENVEIGKNEWLIQRQDAQFLWSLVIV